MSTTVTSEWSDPVLFKVMAKPLPDVEQAKLLASDPVAGDRVGFSVALSTDGSTALIGAYIKTVNGNAYAGAAYVFTRSGSTWSQQAKLLASDPAANDYFGASVALSSDGNTALVGAYGKTGPAGDQQGASYVFIRSGSVWNQKAKQTASDPVRIDRFGFSVSLSLDGYTALIGANTKAGPTGIAQQGAAYVFS